MTNTSTISTPEQKTKSEPIAAVKAGLIKSFAAKAAATMTFWLKETLKWWFRYPIKLFRPATISPYYMFNAMAQKEGRTMSLGYMRTVLSDEGFHFFRKNMLPLMLVNGFAGALLFNVYGLTQSFLQNRDKQYKYWYAFVAGGLAGGLHSVVATPLDNVSNSIPASEFLNRKDVGMFRVTLDAIKKVLPEESKGVWTRYRFLFKDWSFLCLKDTLGFMAFFGIFETGRHIGKQFIHQAFDPNQPKTLSWTAANTIAVLTAGGLAGMAFQCAAHPLERLRYLIIQKQQSNTQARHKWTMPLRQLKDTVKEVGIGHLFRGLSGQLIRTMPPSALGLLVYEIASQKLDNENF